MKYPNLRPGQRGAYDCLDSLILDRVRRPIGIQLAMRCGKSDYQRLVAWDFRERGLIAGGIIVSPTTYLRDQMVNTRTLAQMRRRYELPMSAQYSLAKAASYPLWPNGEAAISITI